MQKHDVLTHVTTRTSKKGKTKIISVTGVYKYPVLDVTNHKDGTKTVVLGKQLKRK